jgi:ActR/RegA family two-component response regulator
VIDDDAVACETIALALTHDGCIVATAQTGHDGLTIAASRPIDVVFLDMRLEDMDGLDVLRALREGRCDATVILMSGFLTVPSAVRAMHMGAADVLEKPIDIDQFVAAVRQPRGRATPAPVSRRAPALPAANTAPLHGSVAERWARFVMQAFDSEHDLKTLSQWARLSGVSYSTLCETCRLVGIRPQAARDFARLLRAVAKARFYGCSPSMVLDVCDHRTLISLLQRGGLDDDAAQSTVGFIERQRLVAAGNPALQTLAGLMRGRGLLASGAEGIDVAV